MEINLCVIGDLHCHSKDLKDERDNIVKDSHIIFDDLENLPRSQNPIESFYDLIEEVKPTIDYLIVAGDLTSRAKLDGLLYGWEMLNKSKPKIKYKHLLVTLGNHDVDTRGFTYTNSLDLPKAVNNGFPHFEERLNEQFWEDGFTLKVFSHASFLLINTAYNYVTKDKSNHGHFSYNQIDRLKYFLKHSFKQKIFNIAVFHHHPIIHDRFNNKTFDILENGQNLLKILEDYNFNLVIHGHKHDPLLSYSPSGTNSIPIFSSGSFAAFDDMLKGAFNSCHLIKLTDEKIQNCFNQGEIITYYFIPGEGWLSFDHIYFPSRAGFGCRLVIDEIAEKIDLLFKGNRKLLWEDILLELPSINYLIPNDLKKLESTCKNKNLFFSPKYPGLPEIITKK